MKKDILNINVFNGDDGIKYIRYDDMISMLNRIKEDNEERDEEIERLNNIINEIEEWLNYEMGYYNDDENICILNTLISVENKIKELKEKDNV